MNSEQELDVIVIGAGHAGCEAAFAAAQMGCITLLLTGNMDSVACLPCSASFGGPGRGHLIREIDALGGEMGRNIDRSSIHWRRANTGKGPAVRTSWALVDRRRYSREIEYALKGQANLSLRQTMVQSLEATDDRLRVTDSYGQVFEAKTIVLAAGTFGGDCPAGGGTDSAGERANFPPTCLRRTS